MDKEESLLTKTPVQQVDRTSRLAIEAEKTSRVTSDSSKGIHKQDPELQRDIHNSLDGKCYNVSCI